ncbi:hypothetical protein HDU99_002993, partial [Rhizoclosmatium hyalinum]
MDETSFPFADCAEDFGETSFNLYYSTPTTVAAIASLLTSTRQHLMSPSAAQISFNGHFLDLGCGDGRAVIYVAKTLGIKCTGVDFSAATIAEAKLLAEEAGVSHLTSFILEDFTEWQEISDEYSWISAYIP